MIRPKKSKCRGCGSIEWTRLTGAFIDGKMHETCDYCPPEEEIKINAPMLGKGTMDSRKRTLTPRMYEEACEKANRTGKDQYL